MNIELSKKIDFQNNSFSFLRYIAAFQVLYGHLIVHFNLDNYFPFISYFSGVPIFFCLSGFLISNSLNRPTIKKETYFKSRFLRIFPELWLAVVVNLIVMLIFDISLSKNISFWIFNITQGTFMQFWTPNCLRIFGVGTPNGSLWTITIFVQFYIIIYWLYPKLKKFTNRQHFLLYLVSFLPNVLVVYLEPYTVYNL